MSLTRETLRKIRTIEIVTERLVRDRMAGQYHSGFKGSGISFSEVRQYQPGDDIRLILGGHLKSGQVWTGQNRLDEVASLESQMADGIPSTKE